jgi:hypothetical protein
MCFVSQEEEVFLFLFSKPALEMGVKRLGREADP